MKKQLTQVCVERVKPPKAGVLQIFDLGYPGLALRVGHGGARTFELFYRHGGKLQRRRLGRWPEVTLANARSAWRSTREAIAKGEAPAPHHQTIATKPELLFEVVAEEWMRRDQSGNKSVYQVTRALEADLLPAWRGKQIDKITKLDVIALLDSITDRGAPAMARRVQSYVNRFFAWCLERDILKVSPVTGMARVGENVTRERVLDDKELKAVWHGADSIGSYGSAVKMLVLTGARREEISALKWSEIKGNEIVLENGRTKNGKRHTIPLSHAAMRLLESLPKIGESEYVFTITGKRPLAAWSKPKIELDGASGVTDWRIHDLRRTCATGMQKLGVNLQTIEAVLNHISGSRDGVVGIYQRHSFDAEKREALEKWGECVNRLVG